MARGRKPKPTQQKLLAGNPGKRALNQNEPSYGALANVDPPAWLDATATELWGYLAPKLIKSGVLTEVDFHNLEIFCVAYARWRTAEAAIEQHGIMVTDINGNFKKNPACTVANEAIKQVDSYGAKLGLDPASRTRLSTPNLSEQEENEFESL
ncbi:phage terminase small subunit P27 family [Spartinivicinus ruber]|uniref:phage terminase small subunit P27 family n=1 Tax=Spartinivicinus ruber TaxID=2683272 RepID=UPI0013D216A6|nr:phage terminase small subunit P27 family [Spartinivicinus ruber]